MGLGESHISRHILKYFPIGNRIRYFEKAPSPDGGETN